MTITDHHPKFRRRKRVIAAFVLAALAFTALLVACGEPEPTSQVVVITAAFTPEPVVVVVTATFTPAPEIEPSDTPTEVPAHVADTPQPPEPTATVAVAATASGKKAPKTPSETASAPEAPGTETIEPSSTPVPVEPSATSKPPEDTPTPQPVSGPTLMSYFVVYTAFKGPDLQDYSLWGMNGDGSGVFQIEGAGRASEPAFSPDGSKLAFYHWTDGLYIWDLEKETSVRIVDNTESSFVTWSPNGNRLAYTDLYGQPQVHLVNADGSNKQTLTPGLRPNWSLSGGFIAYDSCENNKCGIFRINPDGGNKRQLTDDGGGGAAVSPNGKTIAYWSKADGDFEVYAIQADGSRKRQLTENQGNDALPAWSPDGKLLYYLSDQNGKGWAVMAMDANGSNKHKIVGTSAGNDPRRGWQYQRITVTWND